MDNRFLLVAALAAVLVLSGCTQQKQQPQNGSEAQQPENRTLPPIGAGGIKIGVEYAFPGMAQAFAELGIPAVKYYPDAYSWQKMQPTPAAPIDFSVLDAAVAEYQGAGFTDLVVALRSVSTWASTGAADITPKPEHLAAYEEWIRAVVERYDKDGVDDMPGLKLPVRYYEIGTEFSSYEPESAEAYVGMLERAYAAAHGAFPDAVVLHAAFLATTAFTTHPSPAQYEAAFAAGSSKILHHSLADNRKILDRPDIFDAVNFHALGDPTEIEDTAGWLRFEMQQRGYSKPIIISDTAATPFVAWGPASTCDGPNLGVVVAPATEADRCRIAAYFTKLLDGDKETVAWTQGFVAEDVAKRVVVAAEQGMELINTAFVEDIFLLQIKLFKAGAGTSPWSGMAETKITPGSEQRTVTGVRPAFRALKQIAGRLQGKIVRVQQQDKRIRFYAVEQPGRTVWILWLDAGLVLPGDPVPTASFPITPSSGPATVTVEELITEPDQTEPKQTALPPDAEIILTQRPVFVLFESA